MLRRLTSQEELSQLENNISTYRQNLEEVPADYSGRFAILNNMAMQLRKKFAKTGEFHDLDLAIKTYREALAILPQDDQNRPIVLNNLANSLRESYQAFGDKKDLNQAIIVFEEALTLTPSLSLERIALLTNCGHCLRERFYSTGRESDLDKAISLYQEASKLAMPNNRDRISIKNSLSDIYLDQIAQNLTKTKETTHYSNLDTDYITFINEELTSEFLELNIVPLINAISEIQHIINIVNSKINDYVLIKSITQNSPISIGLEGATDTVKLIQETIVPWRRKHSETMARLVEQEKLAEIESKKADILEKRARAARERSEAEKASIEVSKQREEAIRMGLENEKLKIELYRTKVELALGILDRISSKLPEADKLIYLSRLLPSLDILINSDLDVTLDK